MPDGQPKSGPAGRNLDTYGLLSRNHNVTEATGIKAEETESGGGLKAVSASCWNGDSETAKTDANGKYAWPTMEARHDDKFPRAWSAAITIFDKLHPSLDEVP